MIMSQQDENILSTRYILFRVQWDLPHKNVILFTPLQEIDHPLRKAGENKRQTQGGKTFWGFSQYLAALTRKHANKKDCTIYDYNEILIHAKALLIGLAKLYYAGLRFAPYYYLS